MPRNFENNEKWIGKWYGLRKRSFKDASDLEGEVGNKVQKAVLGLGNIGADAAVLKLFKKGRKKWNNGWKVYIAMEQTAL